MKLSKTLLNAVFIGMTAAAVTSCSGATETIADMQDEPEIMICLEGDDSDSKNTWENCAACGMG